VSQENVVPFEASLRRTMARRGAPDKTLVLKSPEVECPDCGAALCLDTESLSAHPEVICSRCHRVFDFGGLETADSRS
jgi:hypothetical protein